ncbi:hypothetical protein ACH9D2_13735 [Kocuria sp. M4R2S49]|uniref:hypothetical protein n=1 Tax=Kocuria rhizosphaericola TaxID=3376284 RepID=UPI0037B5E2CC
MALLFVFGLPALLFTAIGRAAAPVGPRASSAGSTLRRTGSDLARGLRVCAMTSPQYLTGGARAGR